MRIKRLELLGFKSCMERTVLDFPHGVTGVVGPNGCGKSNIVDALRWVLGEQSAKHLRGQSMEDVIFAGNAHHGPLGAAEVTITLDNEGGPEAPSAGDEEASEIVRALRAVPEIQVTRRLFRSGESEYLMNGNPCRLRDITELFLGTGVGTKAYSIIEQGRVGQIVAAKPEELRLFIEEAAGTTLYRSRKDAAERKIERTEDNLLRVGDVLRELERQANSLRRQARGAVRYRELRESEGRLDRRLSAHRLRALRQHSDELVAELAESRGREQALRLRADGLQGRREQAGDRLATAVATADQSRRAVYEKRARASEIEQERRYIASRIEELQAGILAAQTERGSLEQRSSALEEDKRKAEVDRATAAKGLETARTALQALQGDLVVADDAVVRWGAEDEATKSAVIEALAEQATLRNERQSAEQELRRATERADRLRENSSSLSTVAQRLVEEVAGCQRRLDEVVEAMGRTEEGKAEISGVLGTALTRKGEAERRVDECREESAGLRSRFESLRELHESFAGYGDSVRAFMSNGGRDKSGASAVLADIIEIETGYERAVAAVLQDRLQYVVVPDTVAATAGAEYLRSTETGRATFVPMRPRHTPAAGEVPPGFSLLSEHLSVSEGYEAVVDPYVSGVVVADSLAHACEQWTKNGYEAAYVTMDGEVIESSGVVTGGSGRVLDEGLLTRKAELRALEGGIQDATERSVRSRTELQEAEEASHRVSEEMAGLDRRLHELTVEKVGAAGDLEMRRQNLSRTHERAQSVSVELSSLESEVEAAVERLKEVDSRLAQSTSTNAELERRREDVAGKGRALEQRRRELATLIENEKVQEAELGQRHETFALHLRSLAGAASDLHSRVQALSTRETEDARSIEDLGAQLRDPSMDTETVSRAIVDLTNATEMADTEAASLRTAVRDLEKLDEVTRRRRDTVREASGRSELNLKEVEMETRSLEAGVRERLEVSADGLLADADAETEGEALPDSWQAELESVRVKIHRLGTVNLGAVTELEEVEGRLNELSGQRDDLERSMKDLRGTIARLNRLSRTRFRETFDDTNRIFHETFPKLFPGGKASLVLTDENNLLETGVEIMVQPSGKRLGNLNLLSGGEKALVAISLIFSLFLHRPSPFCVLDEVDAPLDEANIGRFTHMVTEMSQRSQFVLITHKKRTMASCDGLYGVTMPAPGVSRIVSVDLHAA